nr:hypothetical protein B0A51_05658 [Rachicladosporium sp. CCFEE 5018]
MSLERAFKRLALSPSNLCTHCRGVATSTRPPPSTRPPTSASTLAASLQTPFQPPPSRTPIPTSPTTPSSTDASPQTPATPSTALATSLLHQIASTTQARQKSAPVLAQLARNLARKDYELQQFRRWRVGDVYAPHDLSGVEAAKWKRVKHKGRPRHDVLDSLAIDPRAEYKNFSLTAEYTTDFGRIKHSRDTGLRPRNQRRMAKAVRRAIGIGLMPSVYRHPQLLGEEVARRIGTQY